MNCVHNQTEHSGKNCHLCEELYAAEEALIEKHLKDNPECSKAKLKLADIYASGCNFEEAERLLSEVCNSDDCSPESLRALALNQGGGDHPCTAAVTLQRLLDEHTLSAAERKEVMGQIAEHLRQALRLARYETASATIG